MAHLLTALFLAFASLPTAPSTVAGLQADDAQLFPTLDDSPTYGDWLV